MVEITLPDSRITRLQIRHRLDAENADHVRERFGRLLDRGGGILLVFEPSAFVDTQGMWALVGLVHRARIQYEECSIAVVSRSRAVDQLIRITRLYRHVGVFESCEKAEAWLADASPASGPRTRQPGYRV